jgi:hypothetical protein
MDVLIGIVIALVVIGCSAVDYLFVEDACSG